MEFIEDPKRYSKVWLWTILTVDVLLLIILPIAIADSGTLDAGSLPENLLFVFVIATLGAIFSSFLPLLIFTFLQRNYNSKNQLKKSIIFHTLICSLAYLSVVALISSFSLGNYNLLFLVAIYQLVGLFFLYKDNKKSIV